MNVDLKETKLISFVERRLKVGINQEQRRPQRGGKQPQQPLSSSRICHRWTSISMSFHPMQRLSWHMQGWHQLCKGQHRHCTEPSSCCLPATDRHRPSHWCCAVERGSCHRSQLWQCTGSKPDSSRCIWRKQRRYQLKKGKCRSGKLCKYHWDSFHHRCWLWQGRSHKPR